MDIFVAAYDTFIKYLPSFMMGLKFTIIIAFTGTIIGLFIGLFIGGIRAIKIESTDNQLKKIFKRLIYILTEIYIAIFRGTPMMVQSVFIYYSLKPILNWEPIVAGIFIISINTGAYMSEIIRSGIQSVDKGQTEAARSLGMNSLQTMMLIVIPQAVKNSFPSIGNEFIVNIKDSSVLNVIQVTELYFQSNSIAGSTFNYTETFFVTGLIYLVLTYTTSLILRFIEKRMNNTKTSYPSSQTIDHVINLETEQL